MEKAVSFSGKADIRLCATKYKFCRRLGDSHLSLAFYLDIPPQDHNRWKAGSEVARNLRSPWGTPRSSSRSWAGRFGRFDFIVLVLLISFHL